jgi:adenylyltransferase/sulfurtransferase
MARVLVVGAGGLGCPATLALARAGVRHLTVVDPDVVELSNLHRQLWHRDEDLGRPKVESLARRLTAAFPEVRVEALQQRVTTANAEALFARHDVVIDGTDGVVTKFELSDSAVRAAVPLIHGGVLRWSGLAMIVAPGGPCLRCLFETPPSPDDAPTCASAGVLGAVAGWVGAQQVALCLEVLRVRDARGPQDASTGTAAISQARGTGGTADLHRLDGRAMTWRVTALERREDCGCQHRFEAAA